MPRFLIADIVLPTITREPAAAVAERLRARVVRHPLTHAGQLVDMTISIGLAMLCDGDDAMEHLLVRADPCCTKRNTPDATAWWARPRRSPPDRAMAAATPARGYAT